MFWGGRYRCVNAHQLVQTLRSSQASGASSDDQDINFTKALSETQGAHFGGGQRLRLTCLLWPSCLEIAPESWGVDSMFVGQYLTGVTKLLCSVGSVAVKVGAVGLSALCPQKVIRSFDKMR